LTTIGVKISKKQFKHTNETHELLIWDLEGATPQKSIPHTYYGGASGAIFVADVSRRDTISGLDDHIKTFKQINPDKPYIIAYNKIDLLNEDQQKQLPSDNNTFLTSAKTNTQVEEMFIQLAQEIFND
jgi:GTPase SAR1 family protein